MDSSGRTSGLSAVTFPEKEHFGDGGIDLLGLTRVLAAPKPLCLSYSAVEPTCRCAVMQGGEEKATRTLHMLVYKPRS